ncbi:aminoglycoside phosphotransferase [Rudanella paleaurantiibacter]|uniref:Aminoglycoside phosphotransferase n=1 Tax=Rudanella paleaurantiibacter TaxID=2614655 RepID=A0A7J5U015_9BACT|nr:aminoglycoside phosphotransferase [Rudanella paleaurantiibacter]KAB7730997.1 aminoglycoside phosphotransferase [Rudanella paleaurantiibacter]
MIRLTAPALSAKASTQLAHYQQTVLNAGAYTAQVAEAKKRFKQYNTNSNPTFTEVKARLAQMCVGARRCQYCEDSVADEVEHIAPKDLYPDRCFSWDNYCYACGPCNGPKNNRYAVFRADEQGAFFEIPPHPNVRAGQVVQLVPPPPGPEVLINPRIDNPLDYLFLDITNSFQFVPLAEPVTGAYQRAIYTIDVLRLNVRADLIKSRRLAYTNFRARLREYIHDRDAGLPQSHLDTLRQNLRDESHQTVWQEMVRQHAHTPELTRLFGQAPEALTW